MRRRISLLALLLWLAAAPMLLAQGGAATTFTYDTNGNMTSRTEDGVVWTYVYDARNLLREVQRDGVLLESYQYDYQGRRIRKTGPGGVVRYVWDGDRILLETDGFGNTIAKYDYAGNRLLSVQHANEGTAFFLFDGLGSVVALIKADGSIAARYSYDAWGNLRREAGQCSNAFLFTGHQLDEVTGLYYAKGRYYDPTLARFQTQDPISGEVLEPLSLHGYLYARANPTRFIDPDGREAMEVVADGRTRVLNGQELHRILVEQERLSPEAASRIVILSELGADIGANRTAAMTPYILGAGELTGILPAERALANPYVQGGLQVVGGTAEVGLGLAAAGTGAGAVASPILAAHGGDLIGTGIRTLATGEAQETLTHRGIRGAAEEWGGADPSTAALAADLGEVGLVGLAGTSAALAIPPRPYTSFGDLPPPARGNGEMVVNESSSVGFDLVPSHQWQGGTQPPTIAEGPYQPGVTPLSQYDIDRYGSFAAPTRVGDQLAGHEMLQNAWLRAHGYAERRGVGTSSRGNPAVALNQELHSRVGTEQARLGLNDPSRLRTMTAAENIRLNAEAMRNAGVPEPVVQTLMREAETHAAALPPKPAPVPPSPPR